MRNKLTANKPRNIKNILLSALFSIALMPQAHALEDFKPSSSVVSLMPIVMENLDILNLTTSQLDQIRGIARQNFSQVEYINAAYHDLKTELKEILLDGQNKNSQRATKIVSELAELDKQRITLTVQCAFNLKNVLGTETFNEVVSTLEFQSH